MWQEINEITLKLPNKCKEINENVNIYEYRNYGLNYNDDTEVYQYNVNYEYINVNTNIENRIALLNETIIPSNGKYKNITYTGDVTLNGKTFKCYDGGYTELEGILFTNIN